MPADPFARIAISSQRSLLEAQFSRSAALSFLANRGGPQGGAGTPNKGPQGPGDPGGPGGGAFGALGAHWDDSEVIPNGCFPDTVQPDGRQDGGSRRT